MEITAKKGIKFIISELKPRGELFTPFNIITIPIIALGLIIVAYRFVNGLGSVTNQSQIFAWGLWKGFNVVTGVAFAAGAYIVTFMVYVLRIKKYHSIVKATVLNGFLSYVFYAGALILDLGRPWNIINPIIGNSFGFNSVLFLVAWHFMLYIIAQFVEFSPTIAEWLERKKAKKFLQSLTLGAVVFGITLSLLHQSGLGALFMMAKSKIHPLWYSEFLPILFLASSVPAGLSMVILEGTISRRVFKDLYPKHSSKHLYEEIVFGLAKGAALSLFIYYFFKAIIFIHGRHWSHITDMWGVWYFIEVFGFVLLPCIMYANGYKNRSIGLIRLASLITIVGIMLNRLNISVISFYWNNPNHYYPSWQEYIVALMVISIQIWVFRWVVTRMPVFKESHH